MEKIKAGIKDVSQSSESYDSESNSNFNFYKKNKDQQLMQ